MMMLLESLLRDVRHALRHLMKAPALAATAIIALALGIGANTAIFSLFDAIAFRTLPVEAPNRLVPSFIRTVRHLVSWTDVHERRLSTPLHRPRWQAVRHDRDGRVPCHEFRADAEPDRADHPGERSIATIRDLQEYRDMLRTVHDRVKSLVKASKSLPAVAAAEPTAEFDARWGHGPVSADQFVAMVDESVRQE